MHRVLSMTRGLVPQSIDYVVHTKPESKAARLYLRFSKLQQMEVRQHLDSEVEYQFSFWKNYQGKIQDVVGEEVEKPPRKDALDLIADHTPMSKSFAKRLCKFGVKSGPETRSKINGFADEIVARYFWEACKFVAGRAVFTYAKYFTSPNPHEQHHAKRLESLPDEVVGNAPEGEKSDSLRSATHTGTPAELLQASIDLCKDFNIPGLEWQNSTHDNWTPLMIAACNAEPGAMRLLLENGADIHTVTCYGENLFHILGALKLDGRDESERKECIDIVLAHISKGGSDPVGDLIMNRSYPHKPGSPQEKDLE